MAALITGECDSKVLADMPRSRMRTKLSQLEEASTGHAIDADIAAVDAQIEAHLAPFDAPRPSSELATGASPAAVARRKAVVAVGRSILVIIWHLPKDPDAGSCRLPTQHSFSD